MISSSSNVSGYVGMLPGIMQQEVWKGRKHLSAKKIKKTSSEAELRDQKLFYEAEVRKIGSVACMKVRFCAQVRKMSANFVVRPQGFKSVEKNEERSNALSPILPKTVKFQPAAKGKNEDFKMRIIRSQTLNSNEKSSLQMGAAKNSLEDPFYYGNIIKNSNFSPFKQILDGNTEVSSLIYPHKWKKGKIVVKSKPNLKAQIAKRPNCSCPDFPQQILTYATPQEIKESLPNLREVKKTIQTLFRLYFFPQKAQCYQNLAIIIFEGTLGFSSSHKKGSWKFLKKLGSYFQIAVILHDIRVKEYILQAMESKKIAISALYCINKHPNVTKRSSKFLDYSQVYFDFDIASPSHNCLIVTCHECWEVSEKLEEIVFDCVRPGTNLLVVGVPVASSEFIETPFVMIVKKLGVEEDCDVFQKFLRDLEVFFVNFRCFRDSFDFSQFFYRLGYRVLRTWRAHRLFLDYVDGHLLEKQFGANGNLSRKVVFCTIHERYYKEFRYNKPVNHFVLI